MVNDDESIPDREWTPGPQTGRQEHLWKISPVPSSIDLSTPPARPPSNGHFTPRPERKPNQLNPPQQDSPIPSFPCEQTLQQPTPGLSGTQWLEDLFCEPLQMDAPPIPGPSPSSKPHEDVPNCEPEPEVASKQSMEEPFACPTPSSPLTICPSDPPSPFCLPDSATFPFCSPSLPSSPEKPTTSSTHSHNDTRQEFTDLQLTLLIP
ncbi:hypothetical protein O181_103326 [Austropuccinia psidii MF-1]|uniref:Uncharacterized protein n=1 Tax=Austropuccinia psidii MF-1 TaxID=1389203 RepID=A0A9Q3JKD1_9BASI|nr:hypothetical protein [Austropuccinia psidii MF-1]